MCDICIGLHHGVSTFFYRTNSVEELREYGSSSTYTATHVNMQGRRTDLPCGRFGAISTHIQIGCSLEIIQSLRTYKIEMHTCMIHKQLNMIELDRKVEW